MSDRLNKETASLEALSALADGEASETESELAFTAWRENPEARARWHEYQVTGDLMRSETLAATATTDADFLAKLRPRLAQEPAVLAPVARPAVQGEVILPYAVPVRHRRWSGPMAVAAGAARAYCWTQWWMVSM